MRGYKMCKKDRFASKVFGRCCNWGTPYAGRHRKARVQRFQARQRKKR